MRKTLLIVEDNELSSDLLVQIFEKDYELEVVVDGEAAVALAARKPPDLVLMDIGLPGMSGLDAVRVMRARAPTMPIVAVSSHVMPGEREQALEAGCDAFVAKPIDDIELAALVARLLGER
jgi:two-component system cell cycle response regulator DivK